MQGQRCHRNGYMHRGWRRGGYISLTLKTQEGTHDLMDSDKEAIVNFKKDHKELNNKTNEHFQEKARKECLWERFVKQLQAVCQGVQDLESQRKCYGKVKQSKSCQPSKYMTEIQNWIQDKFHFLKLHIKHK